MHVALLAFAMGVIAGLRTMIAPTAISWAAYGGWWNLSASPLAFLGFAWTPWLLSVLAIGELIVDKLPSTPSRKKPGGFGARLVSGAVAGAALGIVGGSLSIGAVAGIVGAMLGTLGGAAVRSSLAKRFKRDLPVALIEDASAIAAATSIVALMS